MAPRQLPRMEMKARDYLEAAERTFSASDARSPFARPWIDQCRGYIDDLAASGRESETRSFEHDQWSYASRDYQHISLPDTEGKVAALERVAAAREAEIEMLQRQSMATRMGLLHEKTSLMQRGLAATRGGKVEQPSEARWLDDLASHIDYIEDQSSKIFKGLRFSSTHLQSVFSSTYPEQASKPAVYQTISTQTDTPASPPVYQSTFTQTDTPASPPAAAPPASIEDEGMLAPGSPSPSVSLPADNHDLMEGVEEEEWTGFESDSGSSM